MCLKVLHFPLLVFAELLFRSGAKTHWVFLKIAHCVNGAQKYDDVETGKMKKHDTCEELHFSQRVSQSLNSRGKY